MMLSTLIAPQILNGSDVNITNLTADSRVVREGSLFAALPGTVTDGRDYIVSALENGASAVLSLSGLADMPIPYIALNNPRLAYSKIAARLHAGQPETHGGDDRNQWQKLNHRISQADMEFRGQKICMFWYARCDHR